MEPARIADSSSTDTERPSRPGTQKNALGTSIRPEDPRILRVSSSAAHMPHCSRRDTSSGNSTRALVIMSMSPCSAEIWAFAVTANGSVPSNWRAACIT